METKPTSRHNRRPRVRRVPRHTAKTRRHTAKTSPTVADGKARAAATGTANILFAVCQKSGTQKTFLPCVYIGARRKKAGRRRHGQLTASAAVRRVPGRQAHGNAPRFAVCPDGRHTATLPYSPCARTAGTRQRCQIRHVPRRTMVSSPCARPRHTANLVSRAGHMVTLPCA